MVQVDANCEIVFVDPGRSSSKRLRPTVVCLRGEFDVATGRSVTEVLQQAVALNSADVIADLSGVTFFSASTVEVIVDTRRRLALRSRSLWLRDPSRCARRVLEICDLTGLVAPTSEVADLTAKRSAASGPTQSERSRQAPRAALREVPALRESP